MGGFENVPFGEKDCRNFITKAREFRLGKGGGQALCDYFRRMQDMNDDFYYVMDMDDDARLRNVFWADARSRAAYEFFGDVITFDTTYLTNRYDMPFAPFVGVNHHGQSILFGAGLLSNEDTDTFVWLFESWLKCMKYRAPSAILTDQARAMKNAIARVFPRTRHRYCLWHIMRKFPEKFGAHDHCEDIKSALNTCVYDSFTVDEFEENWKKLIESYQLHNNSWLNGLYSERTFWAPIYMKDTFWAGMTTTQRSESMNAFFDDYVHSQTTLKEFVDQFDNALRKMVENEARSDFNCFNRTIPCATNLSLEKQFQDVYTNAKFKEVHEQFATGVHCNNSLLKSEGAISTYQVVETCQSHENHMTDKTFIVFFNEDEFEVKCTCAKFEFRGIICKHSISVLVTKKVTMLPPRYILDRWRKDIKRKYTLIKSSNDVFVSSSGAQRYDKMFVKFEELASLTLESEEYSMEVMKNLDMLNEKYRALKSGKVLSPVKVKRLGRPRLLRTVPAIEKVSKKSQVKMVPIVEKAANKSQLEKKASSSNNVKKKGQRKKSSKAKQDDAKTCEPSLPPTTGDQHDQFINTQVDPTNEFSKLVSQHKYEEAFDAALRISDVSIVYSLCSQVDLRCILSIDPLPLSQVVLLYLLRHLTYGINDNISQKIGWMIDVANAIIPTDPMIAVHVQPILNEVYGFLNYQQYLPTITSDELSSIRRLIHIICSKIM
ncbi:protein FAR-RED IMPAIRED RESPONSE 1-like [Corylus avellana]|uniref:protein FAR-RED IMPAIRED RESPONSE 1-like n=1 Tax=Corylus avellana TaxID=13451 RepID=UPI00286B7B7B|nr:protein FAR-RED IMPAIRED RESPONSE 1-like [Corylus avellana]